MAPLKPKNSGPKRMSIQSLLNNDSSSESPLFRLNVLADTALEMGRLPEKAEPATPEVFEAANILMSMLRSVPAPAQTHEQVSIEMAARRAGAEQDAALEEATEALANAFNSDDAKEEDEPVLDPKEARAARYARRAAGQLQAPPRLAKKAKVVKSVQVTKKGPAAPISPRSASTASASPESTSVPEIVSMARRVLSRAEMEEEEYERANATEEDF